MAEQRKQTIAEMAEIMLRDRAPAGQRPHLEPHARAVADATEKVFDQMRHTFRQLRDDLNRTKSAEHRTGGSVIGSHDHD